jgi:hypothetical protein
MVALISKFHTEDAIYLLEDYLSSDNSKIGNYKWYEVLRNNNLKQVALPNFAIYLNSKKSVELNREDTFNPYYSEDIFDMMTNSPVEAATFFSTFICNTIPQNYKDIGSRLKFKPGGRIFWRSLDGTSIDASFPILDKFGGIKLNPFYNLDNVRKASIVLEGHSSRIYKNNSLPLLRKI